MLTFKPHLQNHCLIVADGFFEKGIRFIQSGEPLFAMAGLWQPDTDGGKFTMLTTTPNASVSPYHHRMPFVRGRNNLARGSAMTVFRS